MTRGKSLSTWMAGLVLLGITGTSNANLITNGSFESSNNWTNFITLYDYLHSTAMDGWTVTAGSVDWIDNYWTPSDGDKSLDMNGDTAGTIVSDPFDTIPGEDYTVTFDLAGNPNNGGTVTLYLTVAGMTTSFDFNTAGHNLTDMGWTTISYTFTAISPQTTLTFRGDSNAGDSGPALDNVVVTGQTPVGNVPEPATLILVATSLLGLGAVRRTMQVN